MADSMRLVSEGYGKKETKKAAIRKHVFEFGFVLVLWEAAKQRYSHLCFVHMPHREIAKMGGCASWLLCFILRRVRFSDGIVPPSWFLFCFPFWFQLDQPVRIQEVPMLRHTPFPPAKRACVGTWSFLTVPSASSSLKFSGMKHRSSLGPVLSLLFFVRAGQ